MNTFTNPKTIASAMVDLDRLYGKWNSAKVIDSHYVLALQRKWGMTIGDLERSVDYRGVAQRKKRAKAAYDEIMDDGQAATDQGVADLLDQYRPRRIKL